jgi:hypothetical protein
MLVGVDGCRGRRLDLQTVALLDGGPVSLDKLAVKVHGREDEKPSLWGSRLCEANEDVPEELKRGRVIETAVGRVLALVCYDAWLFRELFTPKGWLGRLLRDHFNEEQGGEPARFALIATHSQSANRSRRRGTVGFVDAAECLARRLGKTAVMTTAFVPHRQLERVASEFFPVIGPERETVATMLVIEGGLD